MKVGDYVLYGNKRGQPLIIKVLEIYANHLQSRALFLANINGTITIRGIKYVKVKWPATLELQDWQNRVYELSEEEQAIIAAVML